MCTHIYIIHTTINTNIFLYDIYVHIYHIQVYIVYTYYMHVCAHFYDSLMYNLI